MEYQPTSRDAWESFVPVSAHLDRAILAALGTEPMICQHIEDRTGRTHQAVSGNLRHLVERGLVTASGAFGKTTSGRRAIKWQIVSKSRQMELL